MKDGHFALIFELPFGGLGATYTVHLRLIRKLTVDFLFVLIELFTRYYGWGTTSEYWLEIGIFVEVGQSVSAIFL